MESRIAAAKARANRANNVVLAAAAALFVAAFLAARIAHPARASQPASNSGSASSSQASVAPSSDDSYFDSGSIAPSESAPQLSTGGS